MSAPSREPSVWTGIRRLVERYTPDTTRGRIGLSAVAGPIGVYALMLAFGFLVNPWIGSLLIVPLAAAAGVALTALTLLTLWPVYLSAIGRVDAPDDYPDEHPDDAVRSPTEQLKAKYQRGELSEAEFERELEALLEGSERASATEAGSSRRADAFAERDPEYER